FIGNWRVHVEEVNVPTSPTSKGPRNSWRVVSLQLAQNSLTAPSTEVIDFVITFLTTILPLDGARRSFDVCGVVVGQCRVGSSEAILHVIGHFRRAYLINIGTCGGVEGRIGRFDVVVPDKLVIYDIYNAIGDDPDEGHYMTK